MAQDPTRITADKTLTHDIEQASTPDEIRELLHAAVQRSGIADRDPQTGQFIPRAPAARTVEEPEEKVFSKTVTIRGKEFTFTDESEEGLANQIASAQTVADELQDTQAAQSGNRFKSSVERAEEILNEQARKTELEAMLRGGIISPAQFLEASGAVDEYLASKGVDVERLAGQQLETDWSRATEKFLRSEVGADWPGGERNLQVIGATVAALGLRDSPSAESLAKAWSEMKSKGTIFNDTSDERVLQELEVLSPQEILERFKSAHSGDPEAANQGFIEAHRGGRIGGSGIFNR